MGIALMASSTKLKYLKVRSEGETWTSRIQICYAYVWCSSRASLRLPCGARITAGGVQWNRNFLDVAVRVEGFVLDYGSYEGVIWLPRDKGHNPEGALWTLHTANRSEQFGAETPNEQNRLTYTPFIGHPGTKVLQGTWRPDSPTWAPD